jgi:hypothetical protein
MSEDTYALLVAEHGWSVPEWADWAQRHVKAELLAETP